MNHQTQTLSLEHFVSLEELSNQEVMSLIKRSIEVKENPSNIGFDKDYYVSNLFLRIQQEHISHLKWQNSN